MNILCISKYASIPRYGAAARFFYLCREFKRQGNKVLLLTSDSNHLCDYPETSSRYNFDCIDDVDVCWIKTKKYKKTASIDRVLSWFDFELGLFRLSRKSMPKPDVVLVSSLSLLSIIYGYYLKKKYASKLVFEIRDIWPLTLTEEGGVSRWHPLTIFLGWIERFGYSKSDLIVGTMPKLDKHVEEILGYKKPFFCSPLGVDDEFIKNSQQEEYPDLLKYFPNNKKIVGYAGSMGISNALEAFICCIEQSAGKEDVHFVLVGAGDLKEAYKARLKGLANVTFVPKIRQEQVPFFLKQCDLLYLSTHDSKIWEYGQSMNKVVQYMLAAKPIVASYSGYPSMLNEADCGRFVPSNQLDSLKEAIFSYLTMDQDKLERVGLRGRSWILKNRKYSELAKSYLNVLDGDCLSQVDRSNE